MPNPKQMQSYYDALAALRREGVQHEGGLRTAFARLLEDASPSDWTLVQEQTLANRARPDGTFYQNSFPVGYWEAKDTSDKLDAEIAKKIARGYPTTNIIFEDTRTGVLYQNGRETMRVSLDTPTDLRHLLDAFFSHRQPQIEAFHEAVRQFQDQIPELARGLMQLIGKERGSNSRFTSAFDAFLTICRTAINPNISIAAVEEMLVQHLLTERLFRTVFDNTEFVQRNVIASEIETVIQALVSRAFNRRDYLKGLDRFYTAIEEAARTIPDWNDKQGFLNTVYERFFQGFSRKSADTHGIVYTPQPIVEFMCASVDAVLQREWGRSLSSPEVVILDPATGTGNFVVNLLPRFNRRDLKQKYATGLFANEVMLLPYYIASLNIEHAYFALTGEYQPFEGLCFVDTLDIAESNQMPLFGEENTERVERERNAPVTVIIGNPPYNVGQVNENDNNKNRRYPVIDGRVRDTYAKDSKATLKTQLYDAYVKFFRWATERLGDRDGVVCYVTNNGFLEGIAFDGMRQHLTKDFDQIYHLDLHGDVRANPKLSGTTHNVFGIQVGVGITIAVRHRGAPRFIKYHRVPEDWRASEKLRMLSEARTLDGITWQDITPDARNTWITEGMADEFATFTPVGSKDAKGKKGHADPTLFATYSRGVSTCRDDWAFDFNREPLADKMRRLIETYNSELDRWQRRNNLQANIDDFVTYDDTRIKWSGDLKVALTRGQRATYSEQSIRNALYRPFTKRQLYFDRLLNNSVYLQHRFFPTPESEQENTTIVISDIGHRAAFSVLATDTIPDLHLIASVDAFQCFPFYTYNEDGTGQRENLTDWGLEQFRRVYGGAVSKRDIFHYVYAVLHHPAYRARYAENLKRDLPHIPVRPVFDASGADRTTPATAEEQATFARYVAAGQQLMELHLGYETAAEYPLTWVETPGEPFTWRVEKMRLSRDKTELVVNPSLTLRGIPAEAYAYRLGNRSALEWVIDQYQTSTDKRSGLVSDPNRPDDEQYIARLVGRVVTVSVETVRLVRALG